MYTNYLHMPYLGFFPQETENGHTAPRFDVGRSPEGIKAITICAAVC